MATTRVLVAIAALVSATVPAPAQNWPNRALTMVVPFAAGGPSDIVGRILALHLSGALKQEVIVENVGGAGGMTGVSRAAKAAPDGYQVVLGNMGTHAANQTLNKRPLYNAITDFTPIALVAETPLVLLARKDLPAENLPEFIAYAKANQANMHFASSGAGGSNHLACMLLNSRIGIEVMHVPYRNVVQGMQDVIAGRIDYDCLSLPLALPQIEAQSVKPIALLSKNRSKALPDLASADEQGLTGFDVPSWYALFLSAATPPAIVQKLNRATVAALEVPVIQQRLQQIGGDVIAPERRSPEYLAQFLAAEIKKWEAPIKASGISF